MGQTAAADIATIGRISSVPAILQVISELTGLRFAAVARVIEDSWSSTIQSTMESFARMLALQIEAEENLQRTEAVLIKEHQTAELREQFIAVLGHDLRNPLFAISAGAEMLLRKLSDPANEQQGTTFTFSLPSQS